MHKNNSEITGVFLRTFHKKRQKIIAKFFVILDLTHLFCSRFIRFNLDEIREKAVFPSHRLHYQVEWPDKNGQENTMKPCYMTRFQLELADTLNRPEPMDLAYITCWEDDIVTTCSFNIRGFNKPVVAFSGH